MAKIGEGSLSAWLRLGLAELRNAVSLGGNVEEHATPYGMFGTLTPGEVADGRRAQMEQPAMSDANQNVPSLSAVLDNPQAYAGKEAQTQDHAIDLGNAAPSIAEVLDNPAAFLTPEQQPGHEMEKDLGHEM